MRCRIAAQAARLIAEDGTYDFSSAKRKAARQLGVFTAHSLPANDEIEGELRAYRALYQRDEHPVVIRELRSKALNAMRFFEKFDPYLTGPVLRGTAGIHSAISLQLFATSEKELGLFLLDRDMKFRFSEQAHFHHKSERTVCVLHIEWDGAPLTLALYGQDELRGKMKSAACGSPPDRAGIADLSRLLGSNLDAPL